MCVCMYLYIYIYDVTGEKGTAEKKKERKTPEAMEK